jgi:hypothetical protein
LDFWLENKPSDNSGSSFGNGVKVFESLNVTYFVSDLSSGKLGFKWDFQVVCSLAPVLIAIS